jgi:hypothetical protein
MIRAMLLPMPTTAAVGHAAEEVVLGREFVRDIK